MLGCASPSRRFEAEAGRLGFAGHPVRGSGFQHIVFSDPALREVLAGESRAGGASGSPPRGPLHVYLGGDGSPRSAARHRPPDPTPRDTVALHLMALDPAPSVYLGRPCYHGVPACDPIHWTLGRYSEAAVESLVAALRRFGIPPEGLVLIGFSGGGALAMLMAERLPETRAVVTVAGNLDPGAWTAHHGFVPLRASLDPSQRPPLPPGVPQLHLLGGRDRAVPPALVGPALARQRAAHAWLYPRFDHACCWEEAWPDALDELAAALAGRRGAGAGPRPSGG